MTPDPAKLRIKCAESLGWIENPAWPDCPPNIRYWHRPTSSSSHTIPNFPVAFDGAASLLIDAAKAEGFRWIIGDRLDGTVECLFWKGGINHHGVADKPAEAICLAWCALRGISIT